MPVSSHFLISAQGEELILLIPNWLQVVPIPNTDTAPLMNNFFT